jgi:enoyl-CoA hydratase/carnithine racemase
VTEVPLVDTPSGSREALERGDDPLLCLDLEAITETGVAQSGVAQTGHPLPDIGRPVVVVGVARQPTVCVPDFVDVAVCAGTAAPAPWVAVEHLPEGLSALASAVRAHPHAAIVATQVLRAGTPLDPARALWVESLAYGLLQSGPEHRAWLDGPARPGADAAPEHGPDVTLERRDDQLYLTLRRPQRRNAYRARTRDELVEGLELALADSTITAVHLRGEGPSFSSGGDLGEFGTVRDAPSGHVIRSRRSAALLLGRLLDRTVAHVHGPCFGAGVELSAACGTVVASPDTTLALPEVAMGLIPGAGGTWSVPRRIGRHRATFMALTGQAVPAARALEWGLVDRVEELTDPAP